MKQLSSISSLKLIEHLEQKALLLTVNNRLARHFANEYDQWMADKNRSTVWPSAHILPLTTWLMLQFDNLRDHGLTALTLLDDFSE
ncbi:MAG: hypothetical protein P8Y20_04700, partial [Gammaproteobacteria bacterium]